MLLIHTTLIEGVGTSTEGLEHLQKPADVRLKEMNISHSDVCNSFMSLRISFGSRELQNYCPSEQETPWRG
jgi:hypothetical protein